MTPSVQEGQLPPSLSSVSSLRQRTGKDTLGWGSQARLGLAFRTCFLVPLHMNLFSLKFLIFLDPSYTHRLMSA